MKGRVFTIVSGLSVVLFIGVVMIWARGFWVSDSVDYIRVSKSGVMVRDWSVGSGFGRIMFSTSGSATRVLEPVVGKWAWSSVRWSDLIANSGLGSVSLPRITQGVCWKFEWRSMRGVDSSGRMRFSTEACVPCWVFAVITGVLPAWWVVRMIRRWRRAAAGLCVRCGYDLRASEGRCPECGEEISKAEGAVQNRDT